MAVAMPNQIQAARSDCPLTELVDIIGGRWKVLALWRLIDGPKRFTELRRLMPGVTQKMLTQQLRQMEVDGLVSRKVYPQVPPKVEYKLTETGKELCELLKTLAGWAILHMPSLNAGKIKVPAASSGVFVSSWRHVSPQRATGNYAVHLLKRKATKRPPLVPVRTLKIERTAELV